MKNQEKIRDIHNHIGVFRSRYQRLYQKLREVLVAYSKAVDREKIKEISGIIPGARDE